MLKKTKLWSIIKSINLVSVLFFWHHENPIDPLGLLNSGLRPELSDFHDMRNRIFKLILIGFVILLLLITLRVIRKSSWIYPSFIPPSTLDEDMNISSVGYKIYDFEYADSNGKKQIITTAVWYPTDVVPTLYSYDTVKNKLSTGSVTSFLSLDSPIQIDNTPYPLIIFSHGGYICGTESVFLTEYLASRGFIVASPDYHDGVYLCRIRGGTSERLGYVLTQLKKFKDADTDVSIKWLEEHQRVPGTSKIIDKMLELNRNQDSVFYGMIDENGIGIVGHSYGGRTILGLIGAHPDTSMKDNRINAAITLSGGVFPFEDTLSNIDIPIMVMQGDDNDNLDTHNVQRRKPYDDAHPPKFFLKFRSGKHGSFYNGICEEYSTVRECQSKNVFAQAIDKYSYAFFQRYLKNDLSAETQLMKSSPILKVYEKKIS